MKQVSFITVHVGANYGSVLQTIATFIALKEMGVTPICINYIPPRVTNIRYWKEGKNSLIKLLRRILYFPFRCITTRNFQKYLKKYVCLTKPIYVNDDFSQKCPKSDIYITGSDQVWNFLHNEGYDYHYFFEGIEGRKISFSSSIGMSCLSETQLTKLKNGLSGYFAISVREQTAVDLLASNGFYPTLLLDPIFILNKNQWRGYASKRLVSTPYLFVYIPYNTIDKDIIYETAHKIASKKCLKIVTISADIFRDVYADLTIRNANPGDFLSLFLYADVVVTNSFHGTAFSINLNKTFWAYIPSAFSTRIESLLELCSLQNRLLHNVINQESIDDIIDYSNINSLLEKERKKLKEYLKHNLE